MKYADLLQPAEPLESVKQIRESDTLESAKRRRDVRDLRLWPTSSRTSSSRRCASTGRAKQEEGRLRRRHLRHRQDPPHVGRRRRRRTRGPSSQPPAPRGRRSGGTHCRRFKVIRFDIGATSLALRVRSSPPRSSGALRPRRRLHVPRLVDGHEFEGRLRRHDGGVRGRPSRPRAALHPRRAARLPPRPATASSSTTSPSCARSARSPRRPGSASSPACRRPSSTIRGSPASPTPSAASATFEQVRIAKEDVAFVVEQRLLKRTPPSGRRSPSTSRRSRPSTRGWPSGSTSSYRCSPCTRLPAHVQRHAHDREARGAAHRRAEVRPCGTPRCPPTMPG